ncbi:MAG TPA: enoyl-CoA hydratase/isomerase family protein [Chitinophagaceae bacterium]|nr:enoyl-CoA hydratase/isomerase family protein [Chitinophagaceae bacterium]
MSSPTKLTGEINDSPIDIEELKRAGKVFRENAGASIIDMGDRVALVEFHTKANALNDDITEMLLDAVQEGVEKFDAIVIGNRGRHFSAGANLVMLLESARAGKWKEIELTMRLLQDTNMALKYSSIPVVAAPFSNTLGGGCEVVLHSSRVVAAEDLHMGLVETGVGLIPAGGGTKELRLRALSHFAANGNADLLTALQHVFEVILFAKVSKNTEEAKQLFLSAADTIAPSKLSPIEMAKQSAFEMIGSGFHKADPVTSIPAPGKTGIAIFQNRISHMLNLKSLTEHDAVIALHIATILCGGDGPSGLVNEQQLLDLEREAFLSLLGTEKTQERIEFLLKNNKPLRN